MCWQAVVRMECLALETRTLSMLVEWLHVTWALPDLRNHTVGDVQEYFIYKWKRCA